MTRRLSALFVASFAIAAAVPATVAIAKLSGPHRAALAAAVASPSRKAENVARDRYRNPAATLAFFDVRPNSTVVEIFPGGGWYSEIIAPYVINGGGTYYAAAPDRGLNGFRKLAATNTPLFGLPGGTIGGFANGVPTSAGNFGRITTTNAFYTPRDIQFALKFTF